jgi:cell division transport system permease protein
MAKKRSSRISTFGSQLTSIISVTLVLLILGLIAVGGLAGERLTDDIRRNIGFIVKTNHNATDVEINSLKKELTAAAYVESFVYSSADEIMSQESEYLGEDISQLIDENPFTAEFDVKVKPTYASVDSIEHVRAVLEQNPAVGEVMTETVVIDNVNSALHRFTAILLVVAGALLIISFVLINNTVSLSIYSRRFVIHTMKLVGATRGFIRRPFITAGIVNGIVSALTIDPTLSAMLTWEDMSLVFVGILLCGILICAIASTIATNRYLKADYDEMFMK